MAAPAPEQPKKPATPPAKSAKSTKPALTGEGKVVEEIIARVNHEIITSSELEKARSIAVEEAQQECSGRCTPEQLQVAVEDRQKFALRDLIDPVPVGATRQGHGRQRGRRTWSSNSIRFASRTSWKHGKAGKRGHQGRPELGRLQNNIRNKLLTQEVIRREVGSHITIGRDDAMKYYERTKKIS